MKAQEVTGSSETYVERPPVQWEACDAMPAPECPINRTLELISHKWMVLVIRQLYTHDEQGGIRFRQLQRLLRPVTQTELTKRLRELEEAGLAERRVYAEVPPRVEYQLTDLGRTLVTPLATLTAWTLNHGVTVDENRCRAKSDEESTGRAGRR